MGSTQASLRQRCRGIALCTFGLRQPTQRTHCRSRRAGARQPGTFPKTAIYCHLLPFGRRKTATSVSTIHFLRLEGVPASLGPGLRTVSGADRSLGAKAVTECHLSHDRRIRQQSENGTRKRTSQPCVKSRPSLRWNVRAWRRKDVSLVMRRPRVSPDPARSPCSTIPPIH